MKKYTALRIIATIYKIFGIIVAVLTIISALGVCAMSVLGGAALDSFSQEYGGSGGFGLVSSAVGGLIGAVVSLIGGGAAALSLFAMGEGINLLLALEENTRTTAELLANR